MTLAGKSFLRWKIALCLGAKQTSVHQIMLLSCKLSPFYIFHIFSNKLIPIKKLFHQGMKNTFGREFSEINCFKLMIDIMVVNSNLSQKFNF
jgi:hypothetical protein